MDAFLTWATAFVAAHPQVAAILMLVLAADQILKTVKNALKLNIPDNVFDAIGDILNKILTKVQPPKA